MRERTTWNREQIAKLAAGKRADDPSVLNNPEHLRQQPSAEKYITGDPSDFAEDVAAPNWKAEYSGGEVKRNEIGQPEFRSETFNHPEKTAAQQQEEQDDDFLEKKADVCINLATKMLPKTASEQMIEDQALAFMHMPDAALIETANRLAQQQDQDQGQQEQKQAQQQDDKGQQEQKQAQQQQEEKGQQEQKQAQQQDQAQQQQDKEAGQIPENFKKKDDKDEEKKEAALSKLAHQACQAFQQGDALAGQQAVQQLVQQAQQQQPQLSQEQVSQQIQQLVQQAFQQQPQAQQQLAPQQAQLQPQLADDQLLDQMLQQQPQVQASNPATASAGSMDIQLEGPSMDTGEIKLGSDDEALQALFASHTEVREAAQANALVTGIPVTASAGMSRTAATKTIGTRPNGGVAQLGGGSSGGPSGGGEIDKLAGLWNSAPDVKSVFGS